MTRSDLARAGRLLQQHVRVPESETSPAAARVRLIDALDRTRQRRRHRGWAVAASAVLAVAVAVLVLQVRLPDAAPVAFTVGADAMPGQLGAYVTPLADEPLQLRFSEGSVVELQPATRARVTETTSRGAVVLVEAGRARVDVVHRPDTEWRVVAGPYTVQIQGTSFDVGFDPASQTLEVVMRSGVVSVSGPGISAPVEIQGAQRFVHSASASAPPAASAPAPADEAPPSPDAPAAAPESDAEAAGPTLSPEGAGGARAQATADTGAAPSWAALVARGEYRRVVEAAEQQGIDQALASAGPAQLMALGNAARFSGRSGVASRAYQQVRARFSGSAQAASAAFLLGRMTEAGNPAAAITWYDRYVAEAPAGSFVAEALGRKMIALKRGGNTDAAQVAAHAYLKRFPGGPYAGVAREMTTP